MLTVFQIVLNTKVYPYFQRKDKAHLNQLFVNLFLSFLHLEAETITKIIFGENTIYRIENLRKELYSVANLGKLATRFPKNSDVENKCAVFLRNFIQRTCSHSKNVCSNPPPPCVYTRLQPPTPKSLCS